MPSTRSSVNRPNANVSVAISSDRRNGHDILRLTISQPTHADPTTGKAYRIRAIIGKSSPQIATAAAAGAAKTPTISARSLQRTRLKNSHHNSRPTVAARGAIMNATKNFIRDASPVSPQIRTAHRAAIKTTPGQSLTAGQVAWAVAGDGVESDSAEFASSLMARLLRTSRSAIQIPQHTFRNASM